MNSGSDSESSNASLGRRSKKKQRTFARNISHNNNHEFDEEKKYNSDNDENKVHLPYSSTFDIVNSGKALQGLANWIRISLKSNINENEINPSLDAYLHLLRPDIINILTYQLRYSNSDQAIKVDSVIVFEAEKYLNQTDTYNVEEIKLRAKPMSIQAEAQIPNQVDSCLKDLENQFEEQIHKSSGYSFKSFISFGLTFGLYTLSRNMVGRENKSKYFNQSLQGKVGSYIKISGPNNINFIINPQNSKDNRCFEWCLKIYHWESKVKDNKGRVSQYLKFTDPNHKEYDSTVKFIWEDPNNSNRKVSFPTDEKDISLFEELNSNYSINIYTYEYNSYKKEYARGIIRTSQDAYRDRIHQINLIKITNGKDHYHYAYIKDFNAYMGEKNFTRRFYCRNDLTSFPTQEALNQHYENFCLKQKVKLEFPSKEFNELEFTKYWTKLPTPYYIVADLESINKRIIGDCFICKRDITELDLFITDSNVYLPHDKFTICFQCCNNFRKSDSGEILYCNNKFEFPKELPPKKVKNTINLVEQRANSFAFYVVNTFDYTKNHAVTLDCIQNEQDYESLGLRFVKKLTEVGNEIMNEIKSTNIPMIITEEDEKKIEATTHCWICKYPLTGHVHLGVANREGKKNVQNQQWFNKMKTQNKILDRTLFKESIEYKEFIGKWGEDLKFNKEEKKVELDEVQVKEKKARDDARFKAYCEWRNYKYDSTITVRDHCHFTGKFRGLAHNPCNLTFNYHNKYKIPVFFHNLKGYDSHFLFQWLQKQSDSSAKPDGLNKLKVIPQNTEKFISFNFGDFRFLDSFSFFGSSLESLVNGLMGRDGSLSDKEKKLINLLKQSEECGMIDLIPKVKEELQSVRNKIQSIEEKGVNNFIFTKQEFERDLGVCVVPKYKDKALKLLLEKGTWPYEYFTELKQFEETELPPIEAYRLKLAKTDNVWQYKNVEQEDYDKEQEKWKLFNMKTLRDAHDLYLKVDVISLADVLESRRKAMLEAFELDYMWSVTLPGYAWDAMLYGGFYNPHTKKDEIIKVETFHTGQENMYTMIEKGIRGGICQISHRLAEPKNKYTHSDEYHQAKKENNFNETNNFVPQIGIPGLNQYLWYVDANQLYSWAMTQPLPYKNFQWIESLDNLFPSNIGQNDNMESVTKLIKKLKSHALEGYIFVVDLEYPKELHDSHSDYPLAPDSHIVQPNELSETTHKIGANLNPIQVKKLYVSLKDKKDYIIHYRNLKLYLKLGLKLKAVKFILKFEQQPWIKKFIDMCTNKRKVAKTDWDKDMYKLMCNAVYGKTMECETNRINFEVVKNDGGKNKKFQQLIRSPFYEYMVPIAHNPDLVGVCSKQMNATLTKPKAAGFAVLDLSKVLMYRFYYLTLRTEYSYQNMKLCMTDTDSLELLITTDDLYQDLLNPKSKLSKELDFSNFKPTLKVGLNELTRYEAHTYKIYYQVIHDTIVCNGGKSSCYQIEDNKWIWLIEGIKEIPNVSKPLRTDDRIIPPKLLLTGMNPKNDKVCGKFKDEFGGTLLISFAGNKAKSYSNQDETHKDIKKLKGIPKEVLKRCLKHEHYKNVILNPNEIKTLTFPKLGSQKHAMYQYQKTMVALCSYDDKRYILEDNIRTRAIGHYQNQIDNEYKEPIIKSEPMDLKEDIIIPKDVDMIPLSQLPTQTIKRELMELDDGYGNINRDGDDNDFMYNTMDYDDLTSTVVNNNSLFNIEEDAGLCISCQENWMNHTLNPLDPVTRICYLCECSKVLDSPIS